MVRGLWRRHVSRLGRLQTASASHSCLNKNHLVSRTSFSVLQRSLDCSFSTTTNVHTFTSGAEAYAAYQTTLQQLEQLRSDRETKKSRAMYEAWNKAQRASQSPRSTGVKVVQTLAKQTARDRPDPEQVLQDQATRLLELAARTYQHPPALVIIGNQALDQARKSPDPRPHLDRAMAAYRQAGEAGAAAGWFNLGHLLWTGYPDQTSDPLPDKIDLPADPQGALQAFEKAVDLGDTDAMYFMGVQKLSLAEENDTSVPKLVRDELQKGLDWIQHAADAGHGGAGYYLALFYLNGHRALHLPPGPESDFVRRLDAACAADDAEAYFLRGHCRYHGEHGYPSDTAQALEDFVRAAELGQADAAVSAGAILHSGDQGVERDQERAFGLYQLAGELGSLDGWRNVVACYVAGEGVPQSLETAKYIRDTMLQDDV